MCLVETAIFRDTNSSWK